MHMLATGCRSSADTASAAGVDSTHVDLAPGCRRRWRVKLYRQAPRKVAAHTAMSDIKESLKELQYYKHVLFRGK